jgi:hypothetical protein
MLRYRVKRNGRIRALPPSLIRTSDMVRYPVDKPDHSLKLEPP